jgi:hypothetical protein
LEVRQLAEDELALDLHAHVSAVSSPAHHFVAVACAEELGEPLTAFTNLRRTPTER